MAEMVWTALMWGSVAWLAVGMWLVLTGRAGFMVEMEDDEPCPAAISLLLDSVAVVVSPWWMLRERLTGEPWE